MQEDRITKQKLNVILLIDTSTSMRGTRIQQVNDAIGDIQDYLLDLEKENANIDFYLTLITFSTEAKYYNDDREKAIDDFSFKDIWAGGWSNLHLGLEKLIPLMEKSKRGGIMPDFGGVTPIVLLLTDGHPTENINDQMAKLKKLVWFQSAIKYGIAIELNDERTINCLADFTGDKQNVITCYDASKLKQIMKIIVMTASKVKSSSTVVQSKQQGQQNQQAPAQGIIQQEIANALSDISDEEGWG